MTKQKRWENTDARCPFYKETRYAEIRCEGLEDNMATAVVFGNIHEKESWEEIYCCKHWERCRISQMLEKKYE